MKEGRMRVSAFGRSLLALACLAAVPGAARGDETLICSQFITSVPYTITRPGHYCLLSNLSTAMTTGAAITIKSDSVWLDLNNFVLDGSAAGLATETEGIFAFSQRNVTVRNGVVKGFMFGVDLESASPGRHYTVEDIRAEGNTVTAINVNSFPTAGNEAHVIRRNVVTNTGGSTHPHAGAAFGIVLVGGGRVSDNQVINVAGTIPGQGYAIDLREGTVIASGNHVSRADVGIECATAGKYLRDNVVVEATRPYGTLCTPIGTTNYP